MGLGDGASVQAEDGRRVRRQKSILGCSCRSKSWKSDFHTSVWFWCFDPQQALRASDWSIHRLDFISAGEGRPTAQDVQGKDRSCYSMWARISLHRPTAVGTSGLIVQLIGCWKEMRPIGDRQNMGMRHQILNVKRGQIWRPWSDHLLSSDDNEADECM